MLCRAGGSPLMVMVDVLFHPTRYIELSPSFEPALTPEAASPAAKVGRAKRKTPRQQWTQLIGLIVLGYAFVGLGLVAFFSQRHGHIPLWDSWLIAILFWGSVLTLTVRHVVNRRRERADRAV